MAPFVCEGSFVPSVIISTGKSTFVTKSKRNLDCTSNICWLVSSECYKTKAFPIIMASHNVNNTMNQREFNLALSTENASNQVAISFKFVSGW